MTDIVGRLRTELHGFKTAQEAAAEIERLRAENAEQKAEMQKLYNNWSGVVRDERI